MTNFRELTPQELFRVAADPEAALRACRGNGGAGAVIRKSGEKDSSAPKKRRKKSAAWKTMIAITAKARREKGAASVLDIKPVGEAPCAKL